MGAANGASGMISSTRVDSSTVASMASAWDARVVWLYAVSFVSLLVGPARWYEEAKLVDRFGADYVAYRARVPAFWPRLQRRSAAYSSKLSIDAPGTRYFTTTR